MRDASTHINTIHDNERYQYPYKYNTRQGEIPVSILIQYTTMKDTSTHINTIHNKERYQYPY